MTTLDETPPSVTANGPEPDFDANVAALMAGKLLAQGDTSQDVREWASGRPEFASMWGAVANAMDKLTAPVPAPRITADPSMWDLTPEEARDYARLALVRRTPGEVRAFVAAGLGDPEWDDMILQVAAAMDTLVKEKFDVAAYAASLKAEAADPAPIAA